MCARSPNRYFWSPFSQFCPLNGESLNEEESLGSEYYVMLCVLKTNLFHEILLQLFCGRHWAFRKLFISQRVSPCSPVEAETVSGPSLNVLFYGTVLPFSSKHIFPESIPPLKFVLCRIGCIQYLPFPFLHACQMLFWPVPQVLKYLCNSILQPFIIGKISHTFAIEFQIYVLSSKLLSFLSRGFSLVTLLILLAQNTMV